MNKREARRIALRIAYQGMRKAIDAGPTEGGDPAEDDPKVEDALDTIAQQMYERWQAAEDRKKPRHEADHEKLVQPRGIL